MAPPKSTLEPKSRERLWWETIVGFVVFGVGLVIIGAYVRHELSPEHDGHEAEVSILLLGLAAIVAGMWWINRKLTREMMSDFMGWAMFWKKSGE